MLGSRKPRLREDIIMPGLETGSLRPRSLCSCHCEGRLRSVPVTIISCEAIDLLCLTAPAIYKVSRALRVQSHPQPCVIKGLVIGAGSPRGLCVGIAFCDLLPSIRVCANLTHRLLHHHHLTSLCISVREARPRTPSINPKQRHTPPGTCRRVMNRSKLAPEQNRCVPACHHRILFVPEIGPDVE
jgi:hypothetical protein